MMTKLPQQKQRRKITQQRVRLLAKFLLFLVFSASSKTNVVDCFTASPATTIGGGTARQKQQQQQIPPICRRTRSRLFYRNVDHHEPDQHLLPPPPVKRRRDGTADRNIITSPLPEQQILQGIQDGEDDGDTDVVFFFFHGEHDELETEVITTNQQQHHHDAMDIAFVSFLGFTLVQGAVAVWANSHSMMADSQAMGVDCLSYFLMAFVERMKTTNHRQGLSSSSSTKETTKVKFFEWMATFVGIISLLGVTLCSLHDSLATLAQQQPQSTIAALSSSPTTPNLNLMILFAVLNLALDLFNRQNFESTTVVDDDDEEEEDKAHHQLELSSFPPMGFGDFGLAAVTSTAATTTTTPSSSPLLGNNINRQQQPSSPSLVALSMVSAPTTAHDDAIAHCCNDSKSSNNSNISNINNNLNLSSAQLHVFADTLRSITVLMSAGFAALFPRIVTPQQADAYGCICVSIIILFSILPLMQELAGGDDQTDLFDS